MQAPIEYGSRAALAARITEQRLVQMFDDDGDGVIADGDLVTLTDILGAASDVVTGILMNKGFSVVQLEIVKTDRQVIHAWAGIAAQLAGERKTEWLDAQGQGPYDALGQRGRAELKMLSTGMIRSFTEVDAGTNPAVQGAVSVGDPVFIFNRNPNDPRDRYGPGGF
jgi:hypothetical protein